MAKILETLSTYIARIEKIQHQMEKPIVLSTKVTMPTLRDGHIKKVPWPVFRYVVRGSLTINDSIQVNEGMWVIIRANTSYKIDTKSGYMCITGYNKSSQCLSSQPGGKHLIDE